MRQLFTSILRACVGQELGAEIAGDFEEERRRRASRSRPLAELWFWTNSVRVVGYVAARTIGAAITRRARQSVMDKLISDLRQTWRAAARTPSATLALVLVLSLGVGLTAAMFALADPFLLRPLPYRDPDNLFEIKVSSESTSWLRQESVLPTYEQWRERRDVFTDLAAWSNFARDTFSDGQLAEELSTVQVSANFFDVLGHHFEHTRGWAELARTRQPVLALTNRGQGKTRQGTDSVLTDSSGAARRIAVLLPSEFQFPNPQWTPLLDALTPYEPGPVVDVTRWNTSGGPAVSESVVLIGRLARGVSPSQAAAALSWTGAGGRTIEVTINPLRSVMTRRIRPLAQGALAAGALILIVCIGNVANLLIARNVRRTRELATRSALGASRLALTRMAIVESFLIASTGTVMGLLVAWLALSAVRTVIPVEYTALGAPGITGRVWLFAAIAGLAVTTLAAFPAWLARRGRPGAVFGRPGLGDAPKLRPVRFIVTAVQSSLAVVLATGAALLLQSYANLVTQETGFDRRVLAVSVRFPNGRPDATIQADVDAAIAGLRRLASVQSVAASVGSMIDGVNSGMFLTVNGKGAPTRRKAVTPDFFNASGLPIIAGRPLQPEDRDTSAVVVNRAFARKHWPDGTAVGQVVAFGKRSVPIVGVADDALDIALDEAPQPTVFILLGQNPGSMTALTFMIRSAGSPDVLREPIRRALAEASPGIAIREYSTVGQRLSQSVRDRSFATLMLTFFAIAGLGVSAAGVIGVVMFIVAGRTREIAIRVAIGAQASHVRWLVTREAFWAATTGAVAGAIAGRWLSGSVASFVYGVEAGSWSTTVVAALIAVLLMALAAMLPARRALRLEPTAALRVE